MIAAEVWEFPAAVAAVCAVIAALGKFLHWAVTTFRAIVQWGERIEESVKFVEHETKNNGGKTMRDAIDRTESKFVRIERRLDGIEAHLVDQDSSPRPTEER